MNAHRARLDGHVATCSPRGMRLARLREYTPKNLVLTGLRGMCRREEEEEEEEEECADINILPSNPDRNIGKEKNETRNVHLTLR